MRTYWYFRKFILPRYKYLNTDKKKHGKMCCDIELHLKYHFLMVFIWQSPIYLCFCSFGYTAPIIHEIELSPNFNKACFGKWSRNKPKTDWKTIFWCFRSTTFNGIRGWSQKRCHSPSLSLKKHEHTQT